MPTFIGQISQSIMFHESVYNKRFSTALYICNQQRFVINTIWRTSHLHQFSIDFWYVSSLPIIQHPYFIGLTYKEKKFVRTEQSDHKAILCLIQLNQPLVHTWYTRISVPESSRLNLSLKVHFTAQELVQQHFFLLFISNYRYFQSLSISFYIQCKYFFSGVFLVLFFPQKKVHHKS